MTIATLVGWLLALVAGLSLAIARRALGARTEMVARACHEVRGPLTAVRLGLALSTRAGAVAPARLRAIDLELDRAALALDDLAELRAHPAVRAHPTVRMGIPDLDCVRLASLLDDVLLACEGGAVEAGATVQGGWQGPEAIVWGDRRRLAQVLGNLLVNAIEHGGPTVRVCGRLWDGVARLEVCDDGPGLPAPVAVLAGRPRGGRGRRGRGLAIALGIVEAHGGTLAAAPVGRGGRIVLTLPATAA
jgi:signal transduction histidine kinase